MYKRILSIVVTLTVITISDLSIAFAVPENGETLSIDESGKLMEIIESENHSPLPIEKTIGSTTVATQEKIGLIVIVFGVSLFSTVIMRARKANKRKK